MMLRYALALVALALLAAAPARADGTVYRATGCGDYLFVSTAEGYAVLRADAGQGVKDGDKLQGNVAQIGQPLLFDQTLGRSIFAQVAERGLNAAEVARRVAIRCRSALSATVTDGYVTRASGCGDKIFVQTRQGYAVLERVAGGVVADGDTLSGDYNRPGRATVVDKQSDTTLTVFVADLWLAKSAADRKIRASCRK